MPQQPPRDIVHLFQEFGGQPQTYHELGRTHEVEQARERWPLLSRLQDLPAGTQVPPVRQGAEPLAPSHGWGRLQAEAPRPGRAEPPAFAGDQRIELAGPLPGLAGAFAALRPAAAPAPAPVPASGPAPAPAVAAPQAWPPASSPGKSWAPAPASASARLKAVPAVGTRPTPPRAASPSGALAAAFASMGTPAPAPAARPAGAGPGLFSAPAPARTAAPAAAGRPTVQPPTTGLQGPSPLARLAQNVPAEEPNPPAHGLRQLFARLTGRGAA